MTPESDHAWPALPTETEIYILPNGEIVVADLPAELAASLERLSPIANPERCHEQIPPTAEAVFNHVTDQQHPTDPA